jgi:hypothetical protein
MSYSSKPLLKPPDQKHEPQNFDALRAFQKDAVDNDVGKFLRTSPGGRVYALPSAIQGGNGLFLGGIDTINRITRHHSNRSLSC